MAETAVSFLLEKLHTIVTDEVSLLSSVRHDVELIKYELEIMQAFLRDADRRKDGDEQLKIWVRRVRETAYKVEDTLDEFVCDIHSPQSSGCKGSMLRIMYFPVNTYFKHQLASRLQEINKEVNRISEIKAQFPLERLEEGEEVHDASEEWQRSVEAAMLRRDDEIVGMKKEFDTIVKWVLDEDPRLAVISVSGMPGLGKTTLVSKVFRDSTVRGKFDCFACVFVSKNLRITDLLESIINQLEIDVNMVTTRAEGLRQLIVQHLQVKSYLIILDDVWTIKHWEDIRSVFPDSSRKSRLMVTTRNVELARAMGTIQRLCELEPLNEEEAWELFKKRAFVNEPCPRDLEEVAISMVAKCDGLPVAILSLAGLLLTKRRIRVIWDGVYSRLSSLLTSHLMFSSFYKILLLGFYNLPYYLKHCFLYCSMFPKDYPIKRKRLIRLWVAKGFVKEKDGMTMEEVAEEHLTELINRNMLQVAEMNPFGRVKSCRMHDMMRELAISFSREEEFSITCDQLTGQLYKFRCISIYDYGDITQSADGGITSPRPHSVIVFNNKNTAFFNSLQKMASGFRLLRVLDLKGALIERLPGELVELSNLRYLNLSETGISELPKCFKKLRNLQTLDLRETKVERLPSGIGELKNLRHLFCYKLIDSEYRSFHSWRSSKFPARICDITNLQSLGIIEADQGDIAGEIGKLTQLRRLDIAKVQAADGDKLCDAIRKMTKLVRLKIIAISEQETLNLGALFPPPPPPPPPPPLQKLQKLELIGHLERVPQWLGSLTNLTNLGLSWSRLTGEEGERLLSMLQQLSSLVMLSLHKAYDGLQLLFKEGWFHELKQLSIMDCTQLSRLEIERGAMPSLQLLNLSRCVDMKEIPQGIEHLATLQELYLEEMPTELVDKLREDHQKATHIHLIKRAWKSEDGQRKVERLK